MRIYCINPPSRNERFVREGRCMQREASWSNLWMPLTITYLTTLLRDEGHTVVLRDATAERKGFEFIKKEIAEFMPELVIINSSVPTVMDTDLEVAEIAKKVEKKIKTVFIGVPCILPKIASQLISKDSVDFCVYSEPENVVLDLVKDIKNPKKVKGIIAKTFKTKPGKPFDLNKLPYPSFQDLPLEEYKIPFARQRVAMIETSRGCPYDCIFCITNKYYGKKHRFRDPKMIWDEMLWTYRNFGISQFFFWADTFTLNKKKVLELCGIIQKNKHLIKDFGWLTNSRVDSIDDEMARNMAQANCWLIGFGVESLSQEILDNAKKKTKVEDVRRAISLCRKYKIESVAHVIFGLPGETKESIKKTVRELKRINPDYANFYIATPYPNTELYDLYKKNGFIISEDWCKYETINANIALPNINEKELEKYRRMAFFSFYLNPKKLAENVIKRAKQPMRLFYLFVDGLRFVNGWVK